MNVSNINNSPSFSMNLSVVPPKSAKGMISKSEIASLTKDALQRGDLQGTLDLAISSIKCVHSELGAKFYYDIKGPLKNGGDDKIVSMRVSWFGEKKLYSQNNAYKRIKEFLNTFPVNKSAMKNNLD